VREKAYERRLSREGCRPYGPWPKTGAVLLFLAVLLGGGIRVLLLIDNEVVHGFMLLSA
jgi:hypothetical protein